MYSLQSFFDDMLSLDCDAILLYLLSGCFYTLFIVAIKRQVRCAQ